MKIFYNGRTATKWIVSFIILLLIWFAYESKAETTMEVGATGISAEFSDGASLILIERFKDKYVVGLGLIGNQKYYGKDIGNNPLVFVQRVVYGPGIFKHVGFGIGAGYLDKKTLINGSNFNFALSAEYYQPHSNWWPDYVILRHFSNAGSTKPNEGQDLLSIGYVFGR